MRTLKPSRTVEVIFLHFSIRNKEDQKLFKLRTTTATTARAFAVLPVPT